jgi:hypothetical protein
MEIIGCLKEIYLVLILNLLVHEIPYYSWFK